MVSQAVILAALRKLSLEYQDYQNYKASFGKSQTQPQKGLELSSYTLSLATSTILSHALTSLALALFNLLSFLSTLGSLDPPPPHTHLKQQ